jgi:riboflavin synthase
VDGLGTVEQVEERHDARLLDLRVPEQVARVSVPLGSITVDGVSLTINRKAEPEVIQISLIPFTLQHTTLLERRIGDRVHLEADTIGKYVWAFMEERRTGRT